MDFGGLNLVTVEIIGVLVLLAALAWVVLRTKSEGKSSSPAETERATERLYEEEERRRKDGTEDL